MLRLIGGVPQLWRKAAFWLATVAAVLSAIDPHPPRTPLDFYGDKVAHIIAFSVLSLLAVYAYGPQAKWRIIERLAFLGAAIEVVQSIPALHRDCDVRDWIADMAAVLVVTLAASALAEAFGRSRPR